ncbi:hypothetical protein WJX81_005261 [Elliptochloris bilobata]|uniref:Methyltransferase type 11 domain-containing protein n=1 Tax=Elliptochloris bilobata TaxID=381761 RepID=A0AAW1RF60_9CHLO
MTTFEPCGCAHTPARFPLPQGGAREQHLCGPQRPRTQRQALYCERCERTFSASKGTSQYVDLTPLSGFEGKVYKQTNWGGTTLFETPIMSFIYERGYRQNFGWFGFPGEQKEYEMAMDYLQPAYGEVLVDMSCGSGLFTRRFAASRRFKGVIAADFSADMLDQTSGFISQNAAVDPESVLLLRADITRLPFATGSLAAIHAGAAIHCWPNPTIAMSEIARVLRPGGVFVGTTIMKVGAGLGEVLGDDVVRPLANLDPLGTVSYRPWEEAELRELGAAMGLTNFRRYRTRRFIMFCIERPGGGAQDS